MLVQGAVLCAAPWILTGSIHLDGFMDVTDAVRSCRDLDRRREILKDSHVGSFAVIGCILLALFQFAFCTAAPNWADAKMLILIPVVSRCASAAAVAVLPKMSPSQYVQKKARAADICIPGAAWQEPSAFGQPTSGSLRQSSPSMRWLCAGHTRAWEV